MDAPALAWAGVAQLVEPCWQVLHHILLSVFLPSRGRLPGAAALEEEVLMAGPLVLVILGDTGHHEVVPEVSAWILAPLAPQVPHVEAVLPVVGPVAWTNVDDHH
jgi:hypothetical protein